MFNNNFLASTVLVCGVDLHIYLASAAATLNDIKSIPHLDSAGQDGYREFLASGNHRAFAIAPGGAWAWKGGAISAQSASTDALTSCENDSGQSCIVYAVDDNVVFDSPCLGTALGTVPVIVQKQAGPISD